VAFCYEKNINEHTTLALTHCAAANKTLRKNCYEHTVVDKWCQRLLCNQQLNIRVIHECYLSSDQTI
jgi:hypothetical protein